jgi:hypothetical protein
LIQINFTHSYFHKFSKAMMFSYNNCRFALFFLLSLSANAETVRGAQRELDGLNSDTSENPAVPSPPAVLIGTAVDYTILAKAGITNVPTSSITGNIGVSPIAATAITGFSLNLDSQGGKSTSTQVVLGEAHAASYGGPTAVALTTAVSDMETAYTDAAGRATSFQKLNLGQGELGGTFFGDTVLKLSTGVYTFGSSVTIKGNITFKGSATDVFIIQIAGDLTQVGGTIVLLSGGALAANIFWQVAGEVVVKAGAHMEGILLVKTAVTFEATSSLKSSLKGRILTQTSCALDQATITPA